MEFDLTGEHAPAAYKILASLVTPRPIAWVTSLDSQGRVNAAPFSFFNVFGTEPPVVVFAPGDKEPGVPKDTARNIRETGEFVINLVDEAVLEPMVRSAATLPHGVDELEGSGLSYVESRLVKPPRIAEAPAALECREHSTLMIGQDRLVIGEVLRVWARDGIFDPETGHMDIAQYQPIGRMASPDWYTRTSDLFEMRRPE
ncbi:MAG: flavin reductase (DIM6/NTAB) family NADH-FMN oxidoreductase RutF [Verrucomicrobiales bacterium]|jgi:flavin reductase (DIM6/NTAB) family NADH-FMN oxidoreductase RutF